MTLFLFYWTIKLCSSFIKWCLETFWDGLFKLKLSSYIQLLAIVSFLVFCYEVHKVYNYFNWQESRMSAPHPTLKKPPTFWVQTACVRHPWWRTESKLGIVFTYFFLFFFFLFFSSPPSTFHPLRVISRAWKFVSPNILA